LGDSEDGLPGCSSRGVPISTFGGDGTGGGVTGPVAFGAAAAGASALGKGVAGLALPGAGTAGGAAFGTDGGWGGTSGGGCPTPPMGGRLGMFRSGAPGIPWKDGMGISILTLLGSTCGPVPL